jgi:hypothetical protein
MAYIGQTPSAVPLVAGDIADGIISEAKLAADAVSLAKMKAGTDGNIISYDASGNPVAIATGSSGQVLTSAGAGAPPTFSAAPSHSGNVAFPATQSASGDANTLDDYEEGTWTPVIGGSGGQSGQAYTTQSGTYTKIGRAVTLYFYVLLSTKGTISGSYVYISGAPFSTGFNEGSSMQITSFSSLTNGWTTIPGGYGGGAFWYVVGRKGAAIGTGSVNMAPADISATTMFRGTMTYRV